jgi:hypothetical protein
MSKYNIWTEHGERRIMLKNDEEEEEAIPDFVEDYGAFFKGTTIGESKENAEAQVVEDDLGVMLCEAEEVCETEKESRDLKHMLEDYRILLYPDCKQGHKKLGTTLEFVMEGIKQLV